MKNSVSRDLTSFSQIFPVELGRDASLEVDWTYQAPVNSTPTAAVRLRGLFGSKSMSLNKVKGNIRLFYTPLHVEGEFLLEGYLAGQSVRR